MELLSLLNELNIPYRGQCAPGLSIDSVTDDSRRCGPGTLFVAISGAQADGHQFLDDAKSRGTRVALVSRANLLGNRGLTLLKVEQPRRALALIAQRLAGDPSRAMTTVGVTGTNGKTTVAYLMDSIFRAAGLKTGVLGTVSYRWGDHVECQPAPQTTPSPTDLADLLGRMKADGVQAVVMEVSSHALDQHRVDGIAFGAGGFTNLTQDHLDYHASMEEYQQTKERLFTEVLPENPDAVSVISLDDSAGRRFADTARTGSVLGCSFFRSEADLRIDSILFTPRRMVLRCRFRGGELVLETPLLGLHNAQNCLVAAGLGLAAGMPREAVERGIATMPGVPGRFEFVEAGQPFPIIVDYAHTPDSLLKVLFNAKQFVRRRLIAVIGAGGDRDPGKRRPMGQAAARLADQIIITNDNPRTEQPQAIADAVARGVKEAANGAVDWRIELDRAKAIGQAITMAEQGDVVVITGKGHEDYQIFGTEKVHFDDREVARATVAEASLSHDG